MSRADSTNANRRLIIPALTVALLASSAWAVTQTLRLHELRAALLAQDNLGVTTRRQIDQCEANLRSAGIQLANLSNIVQEASAAAAQCLLSAPPPDSL
jgi:hypothetical protein